MMSEHWPRGTLVTRLYEGDSFALSLIRLSGETRAHRSPSARPAFLTVRRLLYSNDSFHSFSSAEFCSAYLTRSNARSLKETSMRVKKIRGAMKTLFALDKRIGRSKWRTIEASERKLTRDELVRRLAVAESKAGRAWKMISVYIPGEGEDVTLDSFTWHLDWAKIREARRNDGGTYLLRTNLTDCDPKTLWKKYMIQGEIEYAFREMKHDLGLRPVCHQLDDRIEAHIFTSFMAFCLLTTLRAMAREHAPGLTPRQIIANLKTIKMVDVVMPTTDGRVVTLPRYVEPKEEVALLLNRLGLTLPDQPPPKISESPSVT